MTKYTEFKKIQEEMVGKFPQFFAFSNEQLEEGLKKLGAKKEEIVSTGFGGFIKKADVKAYQELWETIGKQEEEFLKDAKNLFEALLYELGNHEYAYTYEKEDTLSCLNLKWETMTDEQKKVFSEAEDKYLSSQEW